MKNKLKKAVCMSLSLMVLASQFSIGVQADETTGASYEKVSSAETGPALESGISAFSRETYVVPGGKLYFEPDTGTIAWADGDMEELTIPDEINETPVKLIGRWSLSGLKKLKKINLPGNRNVLGEGSLAELTSLESVVIPKGYDTVPKQCFYRCTSLKKVSMPSNIASI